MHSADIIIIGGGAAGLMAAAGAAETMAKNGTDGKVIVLEKMPRPGRKIMITGKGRCNFTNVKPWNEFNGHIHPKPNFLKPSFYNLTSEKMVDYLQEHGMEAVIERGDRAFPASHLASDVVDALVRAAEQAGAEIHCGKEVRTISRHTRNESCHPEQSEGSFTIECTDGSEYTCGKLIICTGGLSYPKTGSTGDGYGWAKEFGHSIRPLFPSLTAIVPKGYKHDSTDSEMKGHINRNVQLSEIGESLCGIQLKNVGISLIVDGNEAQNEFGDLDFTDGGIEGPIGFKVSRKCVNAIINGSKVSVVLDLKPAVDIEDLTVRINTLWNEVSKDKRSANKLYKDRFRILLTKVLPMSLIPAFQKLNPNADHKTLAKVLKNWKMDITGFVGYERCVVTAGGVSLEEVTPKTLGSRLIPGLYFAGEVLDLDADTGGYNLQTAFSTGYLAGISAAK
ncbi:MAG: aminoacetone oxidase family FAD-binding enzyme [Bacteroidales bacterium]|nr:aminoacetone oxidase family FAD-binding enzyme [Bacteroidales bacterium]MBQ9722343.1 aminoacetone oxidase family FAD-binding enzyme [Bacteroidales bacterium]